MPLWSRRASVLLVLVLLAGSAEAATFTCQDRFVSAMAWDQWDFARAGDYGPFTATSSLVFSGPDGLKLELVLDCTGRFCGPDSLASTQPIPAGDYTLQVEAIANDAGSAAGGDWEASASIGVQVELNEPLVPTAETAWSNVKNLYRDRTR